MQRLFRFCLSVILLISLIPVQALAATAGEGGLDNYEVNLLNNGTFDATPQQQGAVEGWDTWSPEDESEVVFSPLQADNPVLRIQTNTNGIPVKWGVSEVHQWVDLEPGQQFVLNTDVLFESADNSMVIVRIDFFDDTLDQSNPNLEEAYITHLYEDVSVSEGFQNIEITGTVPEGTRYVKVEFDVKAYEANATGTAYFDNARLLYQWAPTHLRSNITNRTETSITLEWDKPLYGEGYTYKVYQLIGDNEVELGETDATSFTWTDENPPANPIDAVKAYSFYVKAISDGSISWPSNVLRAATKKPAGSITIMPLGDSLTEGYTHGATSPGGYRAALWEQLQSKHPNSLYVGSLRENPSSVANFDPDHEGHAGAKAYKVAELVDSQVAAYAPDYVLLMSGTNDMWESDNEAAFYMRVTLDKIMESENLQHTYVIVSSIPDIYLNDPELRARIVQYNNELAAIVATWKAAGKNIGFIDINRMLTESYFTYPESDFFHPDANGYNVMADVWFDALDAAITTGDVLGRFPTAPVLNAPELIENNTAVRLSWQQSSDNSGFIDYYKITMNEEEMSVTGSTYSVVLSNLAPAQEYTFSIVAADKAGNETVGNTVTITTQDQNLPDVSPPSAPEELQVIGVSHNSVTLSWKPGTDDVGIKEHRIRYGNESVSVTDYVYGSDRITYEVTGLSPATLYNFEVKAIDHANNESNAAQLSVETIAAPPSNLHVAAKTTTSVTLAWNAATDGVTAYRIYQDGLPIEQTDQTQFTIGTLTPGQTYKFQVTGIDANQIETLKSAELAVTMELQAPRGLVTTASTEFTIDIQWSNVGGASGYVVYINGNQVATTSELTYRAEGLHPDTTYSFAIQSLFGEGLQSELSPPSEFKTKATPPPPPPSGGGFFFMPPPDTSTKYESTDKGVKLTYAPKKDEALKSLNGSDARLTINVPSDKPFDLLQLELDGEVWKLAADKKKPVAIRMGGLVLELTPGWLNIADKDKVTFTIVKKSLEGNKASASQSLKPLSDSYDLTVVRNGEKVTEFTKPVRLTISTKSKPDSGVTGIYLWDSAKGAWISLGGTVDASGNVSLDLAHFSEYAVFNAIQIQTTKSFVDITNHWARKEIESLAARGIVNGATADRFNPSGEVTRAEFAAMLARAFNLKPSAERPPFDDVKEGSWYYDSISAAYQAGWIQGVGGGKFAPSTRITREEMAVMIWKAYASAKGSTASDAQAGELIFADAAKISKWAVEAVEHATALGLIQGMSGSFKPELYADRAQAAVMIFRLLDKTE